MCVCVCLYLLVSFAELLQVVLQEADLLFLGCASHCVAL